MTQPPPFRGFGIGLRPDHYQAVLDTQPKVDWFEIISEDFMNEGGAPLHYLDKIRQDYPISMHGVSLSIGSVDPLDWNYLRQLKKLVQRVEPLWISDHICWTGVNHVNLHDLMPIPCTKEAVQHVVDRVRQVQEYVGRRILLENVSSYITFKQSEMTEWEFLNTVAERADCLILLDINNIYVNAFNHGFSAHDFLHGINLQRVWQFHLAGHKNCQTHIIDTHDDNIIGPVWELYRDAITLTGKIAVLIERDDNIPDVPELLAELSRAKAIYQEVMRERVG